MIDAVKGKWRKGFLKMCGKVLGVSGRRENEP